MEFGSTSIPPIPPDTALPLGLVDIFYFHTDYLGTPMVMTNDQANVAWTARYYPFGEVFYEWATATNNIRFPGQWQDDETDLYYNWHRYYDPATGRYLQLDPIGLAGGINPYAYVGNNPISNIDPFGLPGAPQLAVGHVMV
jgi:RHS repeat-associated protein